MGPCRLEQGDAGRYVLDRRIVERNDLDRIRVDGVVVGEQDLVDHRMGRSGMVGRRMDHPHRGHHRIGCSNMDRPQLDRPQLDRAIVDRALVVW